MITVNNCGHDSHHPRPCNIEYKNGLQDYLILLIKKDSWFYLHEKKTKIEPNTVLLFYPDTYIHYGCDNAGYNDDWIHFSFTDTADEDFFHSLHIPTETILRPYDFHRLSLAIQMLSDTVHTSLNRHDEINHHFISAFLLLLNNELQKSTENMVSQKFYPEFSALRTKLYNNPSESWNVPEMAASVVLSLSYFQHLYKSFFGCSCQKDIITARLTLAKFYLETTEIRIKNLSEFCGYENELHFMRQFKKFIGMTPSEYRNRTASET